MVTDCSGKRRNDRLRKLRGISYMFFVKKDLRRSSLFLLKVFKIGVRHISCNKTYMDIIRATNYCNYEFQMFCYSYN